jgi:hypothetical protein
MIKRKSFLIHIDSLDVLDALTNEQAGELFKAMKSFQLGDEIELNPLVKIAFSPFKNQFIRDDEKYKTTCERRADAGSKGGIAKASKAKQKVASASKCKQDLANVADSKNKNDSKSDNKNESDNKTPMSPNGDDHVQQVFDYWCSVFNKSTTSKLTKKRSKVVSDRLKEGYTVEQLKQSIDGCSHSEYHMGKNDTRSIYNDLELICRSGEKVEQFASNYNGVQQVQQYSQTTQQNIINAQGFINGE